MKNNKNKKAVEYIVYPVIFAVLIIGAYIFVGTPVKDMIASKIQMAIVLGAPEHNYIAEDRKLPTEGEIACSDIIMPSVNRQYGEISCEDIKLEAPLYYGDSDKILQKGAGQYIGSGIPGEGKTILVGGHDMSFFAPLENIKTGNIIELTTQYGSFRYEVIKIAVDTVSSPLADIKNEEKLVLYTCYPFAYILGTREKRYFAVCEKISGPVIAEEQEGSNE